MRRSSTTTRVLLMFLLVLWPMVYAGGSDGASDSTGKKARRQQYQVELEKAMGTFFKFLGSLDKNNDLTKEQKERKAIGFVKKFRFGRDKKDSLFIADLNGRLIMDPYQPHLNGEDLFN